MAGVTKHPNVVFRASTSAVASYRAAALRRERDHALICIKKWLDANDPEQLISRPIDEQGWKRIVERGIMLDRYAVGGSDELTASRPRLRRSTAETRGERAIAFIRRFCRVPEGPNVGKPLELEAFQRKFITDVLDNPHGTREAILSLSKKNGKSALISALLLVFLIGPEARYANAQIVSGAMEREQAAIVFKYAAKIVALNPVLNRLVGTITKRLIGLPRNIEFRALAAVAKSTQGISPFLAILDEIGQVRGPSSEFVDAIETSQGAYSDALRIILSTQAPEDGDLLSIKIDRAMSGGNPHLVCHLYAADYNCDVQDEEQWRKSNPGLGTIRSVEDLRGLAEQASDMPSFAATFRNFNLNQRVATHAFFVPPDIWEANALIPGKMDGMKVWGGLDLSSVSDLCALVMTSKEGDVWPFFWLPSVGLREKQKNDKVPYEQWQKEGYLFTTPGATVEYEHVAEFLRGVFDRCDVQSLGFDRHFMRFLKPWLIKAGFSNKEMEKFVEFGQGFVSMAPAIRTLESKLLNKKLRHGGNPILRACASNAVVERDAAGNRKFNKARATGKIDGLVALTIAEGVMPGFDEPPKRAFKLVVL